MPRAAVLCRLGGLFAVERLLSPSECRDVAAAMRAAAQTAATVRDPETGTFVVDPLARRVKWVEVAPDVVSLVNTRLDEVRPAVAAHYGVELRGQQTPQFLAYSIGDFYKAHRDNSKERDAVDTSQARRISAVLFLNDAAGEATTDTYGGGALTFYGLLDDARALGVGLPLEAEAGLLITFRADTIHGVAPVTHGHRFTAVSWYT